MFLPSFVLAQAPTPVEIVRPQEVRPLPGELDQTPVFNSNSPEKILEEGILLSTFPPEGKATPEAHLDFAFNRRFDLFAHHVAQAPTPEDLRSLYVGVMVHNPNPEPVTIYILSAASYLSQPDAPFISLDPQVPNPDGNVYAGPGSRAMNDILRDRHQSIFPKQITIAPNGYEMLVDLPIPVRELTPPLNGRSTYMKLFSDAPVHAASLALFATPNADGTETAPTLEDWQNLLVSGKLATPRDNTPSVPGSSESLIYGRVAGVSEGATWTTAISDPSSSNLAIPAAGEAFSYGISTLVAGTHGTGQVQTAPMLVRYPDTAYAAHGNYGVHYDLSLPLHNSTNETQTVTVALETPIKQDTISDGLRFFQIPPSFTFFRGTVRVSYEDDLDITRTQFFHLVQQRGQQGEPLVTLTMPPGDHRMVNVQLLYPPDSTPPQVLTVQTKAK